MKLSQRNILQIIMLFGAIYIMSLGEDGWGWLLFFILLLKD